MNFPQTGNRPIYEFGLTRGAGKEPPVTRVDIPVETMKRLLGRWSGAIGALKTVFRFQRYASGENALFVEVPQQGAENIPVFNPSLRRQVVHLDLA